MRPRMLLGWMALLLVSCAQAVEEAPDPEGALTLALTATDSAGVQYRLRNAHFEVSGYPDGYVDYGGFGGRGGAGGSQSSPPGYVFIDLSSETDPDAALISTRLVPGQYNVALINDDWYLERTTEDGVERVEQAVLLSPRYQYTYVWDGGVAQVNYRFGVDGEYIDFRSGELQIGIEIEKPGEHCPGYGYGGYGGYYGYAGYGGSSNCGSAGYAGGFGTAGSFGAAGAGGAAGVPVIP